jgi:uncharacterized protein YjbI with pentapeptide repeats
VTRRDSRARGWRRELAGAGLTGVRLAGAELTGVGLLGAGLAGAGLVGYVLNCSSRRIACCGPVNGAIAM